ncbi:MULTISPECIES: diguanylate cyclase [unclassified Halomonas]|uniref:diguanylate cyclase n=1 Tax=unclassified Halomonas TaxID=2609666 RepID=UPI0007D8D4DB|nr:MULTISPECIES: diguanylate cyclase [unclassified Halomonas]MBT2786521.1 diguanylate cyclase [Halomonas sp. ISL-106]MBT2797543.1 diguanylate cyclase [Halomonas sp. ISL-104]OAL58896.1 diguanylate cyclase [Halomonas sp. ALS9]
MRYKDKHQLAAEWQTLLERTPKPLRQAVETLVESHGERFAEHFYRVMLEDPHASLFLSNDQVEQRLNPSMQRWLKAMFTVEHADFEALVEQQEKVGQVHARIDIPVNLVLNGARQLKQAFYQQISATFESPLSPGNASVYVSEHIDMAMEIMSHAYSVASDRNARTEEAYKLFSLTQSIGDERERQRSALLNWENALMFAVAAQHDIATLPKLANSDFGLWYLHKACHAFEGAPEIATISRHIQQVDREWLEVLLHEDSSQRLEALGEIRDATRTVLMLLDDVLERASGLDAGRDSLTRLLNRKFLPVVLSREIDIARHSEHCFALLMVDIDHFKSINDTHGHDAGDSVLQQVASIFDRSTRGGDYVFRMGGEEFLIVLVDTDHEGSRLFAERLRQSVAKEPLLAGADTLLNVTISVGVTLHDGHPDYHHSLQRADQALYQAKRGGRDRVVVQ